MFSKFKEVWKVLVHKEDIPPTILPEVKEDLLHQIRVHMSALVQTLPSGLDIHQKGLLPSVVSQLMGLVFINTKDPVARAAVSVLAFDLLSIYKTSQALSKGYNEVIQYAEDRNAEVCNFVMNKISNDLLKEEQKSMQDAETMVTSIIEMMGKEGI